jgi:hypothetical protein
MRDFLNGDSGDDANARDVISRRCESRPEDPHWHFTTPSYDLARFAARKCAIIVAQDERPFQDHWLRIPHPRLVTIGIPR